MKPKVFLQNSPAHLVWKVGGWSIVALAALWVVYMAPDYMVPKFSLAVSFALALVGLNLVTGFNGQINLGHSAFVGLGAYTTVILVTDHGWPFLLTLPVAMVLGFVVGFLVGIPALRITGLYLALITLALAIAFPAIVKRFDGVTGGDNGKTISAKWVPPDWLPGDLTSNAWVFVTVSLIALLFSWLVSNLVRSRAGRGLVAIRDNQIGAAVSGVNPPYYKTMAFAVSSMVGGVAGSCYALSAGTVSPNAFGVELAIKFIAGLVVGGVAALWGSWIGGAIIEFVPYYSSEWLAQPNGLLANDWFGPVMANALLGLILIVTIFVMPGGIIWGIRQLRAKFVMFVPALPTRQASRRPISSATAAEEPTPVVADAAG